MKNQCSELVYHGRMLRGVRCSRSGSMFEDGKWWCKQHALSFVQAKQEAYREKSATHWREVEEKTKRNGACIDALAHVPHPEHVPEVFAAIAGKLVASARYDSLRKSAPTSDAWHHALVDITEADMRIETAYKRAMGIVETKVEETQAEALPDEAKNSSDRSTQGA